MTARGKDEEQHVHFERLPRTATALISPLERGGYSWWGDTWSEAELTDGQKNTGVAAIKSDVHDGGGNSKSGWGHVLKGMNKVWHHERVKDRVEEANVDRLRGTGGVMG